MNDCHDSHDAEALRHRIRSAVTAEEPAFRLSAAEVRRAGQRSKARLWAVGSGVAAVLIVVAGSIGVSMWASPARVMPEPSPAVNGHDEQTSPPSRESSVDDPLPKGFSEEDIKPGCEVHQNGVPIDCLTEEYLAKLPPERRRSIEMQLSDHPGELSIFIEGDLDENHPMMRKCRGLPDPRENPRHPDTSALHPLICNALELMAAGEIPTGHHYREDELKELAR